ncbi:hypothetical protein Patl1_27857 [Pistacia atlantica]|uniref:Uncharacterized protein n=1 Tax=Pistacia atlantica TaxID=434234 RepID=A0ACC1BF55_9ROSI|nr:hypothetical protein Patl1_27857 [Pistacia atlantica]
MAGQTEILKKLLASTGADLELKNDIGYTTFSIAAINGFKDMVEPMLERDENLVKLKDVHGLIPIVAASFYSSKEMVRYLYTKTPHEMLSPENTDRSGATLLNCLITDELYDVALHLLERYPSLGFVEDLHRNYAIRLLAHKRSSFPSGNRYVFCKEWIYSCMRVTSTQCEDEYPQSSDEESNIRIELKTNTQQVLLNKLRMLLWNLLTWIVPDIARNSLSKIGWDEAISDAIRNGITEFIDEEVSSILPPKYMEEVNENNKTPSELFTDEHQELMKQGESWMKNTAASCMVVATLIAGGYVHLSFHCSGR